MLLAGACLLGCVSYHAIRGDAMIGVRVTTSQTMQSAAEILAYGTAVRLAP
jgi:uncharacterized protein YbjQ (UPF0145 family)